MADMIKEVSKNQLYPVFLKLQELKLLLVGGGNVALEKLNSLLSNSPDTSITIVAPFIREEVRELVARHPHCQLIERKFEEADLDEKDLVICATDDKDLHVSIKYLAGEKGILVNVADTPDLCDFYLGSIVQKGQLKIAISTNGKSPTAAKRIREVLNDALPSEINEVINNLHKIRNKLNGNFNDKVKKLKIREGCEWNYSYYPVIFESEKALLKVEKKLNEVSVFPRRYFYPSLNVLPYIVYNKMEISESIAKRVLCLPLFVGLQKPNIQVVIDTVNKVLDKT